MSRPLDLVLFTHPPFLGIRSQALFAESLMRGFTERGHRVSVRHAGDRLRSVSGAGSPGKWAGYADQYLLYPPRMRSDLRADAPGTLYVFCDHALGPWVPHVLPRPHVVHCHDLLALRSALGDIAEHQTSVTGRIYQRYIRRGFRQARHFISISERSRADLHRFGGVAPAISEVVYNGLNRPYRPVAQAEALATLRAHGWPAQARRPLVHVGNGQWYKNTAGVLAIYRALVASVPHERVPPLVIVGPEPAGLADFVATLPRPGEVRCLAAISGDVLEALYSHAEALLVPSLAEGFGWPIAEALACGCPVVTTDEAPMTEVGGSAANYLPRLNRGDDVAAWAKSGARVLKGLMDRSVQEAADASNTGREQARRFDAARAIDSYLDIYRRVLARYPHSPTLEHAPDRTCSSL